MKAVKNGAGSTLILKCNHAIRIIFIDAELFDDRSQYPIYRLED